MKRLNYLGCFIFCVISVKGWSYSNGIWPEFRCNHLKSAQSDYTKLQNPEEVWSIGFMGEGSVCALSQDGKLYILDGWGAFECFNSQDGNKLWEIGGLRGSSSPAIGQDGTVYVGCDDGKLYAINPATQTVKWNYTTGGAIFSSPTIGLDNTIYVGSNDGKLYALNPDGSFKWSFNIGSAVHSSPAIGGDGTIYVGSDATDNKLYAINPDGTLKWSYTTGSGIAGVPAIGPDGTIYVIDEGATLYAVNPDGTLKWSQAGYQMQTWCSSRCVAINGAGKIFAPHDRQIYALNPDGSLIWQSQLLDWQIGAPPVMAQGIIYVGDNSKTYAIDEITGNILWTFFPVPDLYGIIVGNDTSVYCVGRYGISKLKPSSVGTEENERAQSFIVSSPNLVRGMVEISYTLPVPCQVRIEIYNSGGRLIKTINQGHQETGLHRVSWDLRTDRRNKVVGGIYFYRFDAGNFTSTKKLIVL